MNRRSFISSMLRAGVAAMVLPSATTYARHWVQPVSRELWVPNPDWINAKYEVLFYVSNSSIPNDLWACYLRPFLWKRSEQRPVPPAEYHELDQRLSLPMRSNSPVFPLEDDVIRPYKCLEIDKLRLAK